MRFVHIPKALKLMYCENCDIFIRVIQGEKPYIVSIDEVFKELILAGILPKKLKLEIRYYYKRKRKSRYTCPVCGFRMVADGTIAQQSMYKVKLFTVLRCKRCGYVRKVFKGYF
ncbi:MAG TPA: hypothetical protein ENG22_00900 [Candidatus Bathyarchaeota archaeon]|nr:hypothetical protein [Candidatus Bathyarchaeota archaeon]